jgi:phospholipid/cholesterol/gamma-HCH transport system permease protein
MRIDIDRTSAVLHPTKGIDRAHARELWREANRILEQRSPAAMILELDDVLRIDGAGVALLRELEQLCRRRGIAFSLRGARPNVSEFLEFVDTRSPDKPRKPVPQPLPLAVRASQRVSRWLHGLRDFTEFVGEFAAGVAFVVAHPRRIRAGEIIEQVEKSGADALLLLLGLSVVMGIILAFEGISGTRALDSPLLVADTVTLSTAREMAPLLTGIIMTGRSGAAIAAEIGTMKIEEELDALSVMGFDVMRFLLIPRTFALVIATPLLTMLSVVAGITGGSFIAMTNLHLTAPEYFGEVEKHITGVLVGLGLVKGATFGVIAGVVSCFHGLRAGRAAEDVGRQTTTAVVQTIVLIILADAFFSGLAEVYQW